MESFDNTSAMDTAFPAELAEVIALHKEMFGGWQMLADEADDQPEPSDGDDSVEDGEDASEADAEEDDIDPEGTDALGDPGKKALDAMKSKWRDERDKRRELERKLRDADKSEPDPAVAEALAQANRRILRSEVKAIAKGKLSDPTDAFKFLDLDQFDVSEDGEVNEDDISEAINELLEEKPYLAATAQGRRFNGSADQGVKKSSRPAQLSRDDIKRMSPEQILAAKAEGRLSDLLKS